MKRRLLAGVTLLELLVVVAIAGIMASMAVPSFTQLIQSQRMTTQVNDLLTSLYLARSEAIKANLPAVVCHSADPYAAEASLSCGGTWADGWIVFLDVNTNEAFDNGTDNLLARHESLPTGFSLEGNTNFVNMVYYRSNGRAESDISAQGTGTFLFCDGRGASHAKRVIISPTGRSRVDDGEGGGLTCP